MGLGERLKRFLNRKSASTSPICPICNHAHDTWPTIAFLEPYALTEFSDTDRAEKVKEKNDDFCIIEYPDQTDRFIRAVLLQEVRNHCKVLDYGIWVTLSEKSFEDYNNHFFDEVYEAIYFGYLANHIPPHKDALHVHCNVIYTGDNRRPIVVPHKSQRESNSFVDAYYIGITIEDAEKRISLADGSN